MEQVSLKIGERLKEIRNTRQLTLDDVAELTGVSKPMLGQIERGQSSPTINILWKISTGLKIPLSFFCKQEEAEYMVAGLDGENVITEECRLTRCSPLTRCGMWRYSILSLMQECTMNRSLMWRAWRNMFFWCRGR